MKNGSFKNKNLPIASGRVCACSMRSRLVFFLSAIIRTLQEAELSSVCGICIWSNIKRQHYATFKMVSCTVQCESLVAKSSTDFVFWKYAFLQILETIAYLCMLFPLPSADPPGICTASSLQREGSGGGGAQGKSKGTYFFWGRRKNCGNRPKRPAFLQLREL